MFLVAGFGREYWPAFADSTELDVSDGGIGHGSGGVGTEYEWNTKHGLVDGCIHNENKSKCSIGIGSYVEENASARVSSKAQYLMIPYVAPTPVNFPSPSPSLLTYTLRQMDFPYNFFRWQSPWITENRWTCQHTCTDGEISLCSKSPSAKCISAQNLLSTMNPDGNADTDADSIEINFARPLTLTEVRRDSTSKARHS